MKEKFIKMTKESHTMIKDLPIGDDEFKSIAWGTTDETFEHKPLIIPRGKVGPKHIKIEVLQAGICHTDIKFGTGALFPMTQPFVGCHEILGLAVEVGAEVNKFKVGDQIGVGCIVDSCKDCEMCDKGCENQCQNGMTGTYAGARTHGRVPGNQTLPTQGGQSEQHVVHEEFGIVIAPGIPLPNIAPVTCAGVTLQTPMKYQGAFEGKKMKIGIVGVGGLGTMGIKMARAAGHHVVAFSSSAHKEEMAKEKGATEFCCTSNVENFKSFGYSCDLILNTVSSHHDMMPILRCLKKQGVLCQLGLVTKPMEFNQVELQINHWTVSGTLIGGIKDTEDCVEFCAKHQIWPDVEVVNASKISWAWDQLAGGKNKDGVRQVVDIKKSLDDKSFLPK